MAFDGISIAALCSELSDKLTRGRIAKIAQPEKDELLLQIKSEAGNFRLLLSADASLPLIALTEENKKSPLTAPSFCMLLRKHISGGRILSITQPGLDRIVEIEVEHLDEMGDLRSKKLIVELMGKHSNLIFCDSDGKILDAIKHVSALVSSVREVLPGKQYFRVDTDGKPDLMDAQSPEELQRLLESQLFSKPLPAFKAIYQSFRGISPIMAQEICYRSGIDGDRGFDAADAEHKSKLVLTIWKLLSRIRSGEFSPCIVQAKEDGAPVEFGAFPYEIYAGEETRSYESMSEVVLAFYGRKAQVTRIRQKSADLRHITTVALERQCKKLSLQLGQLEDTQKRDKYKLYGELLHTYGYLAESGQKSLEAENYYTNEPVTIPLDPTLTAMENAKKYFDRYGKLKRTFETLSVLVEETRMQKEHLESVLTSLNLAENEEDLSQIRAELVNAGYIKSHAKDKKKVIKSQPLHFVSSDGFDLYVGKNNFQNEEITFKLATGGDWWFHAKGMPGSHVILKTEGKEVPDRTFEEAGSLAAHFSKSGGRDKIEVDYIQKKHVKKPAGANPGFVVYYTNYSMLVDGDISALQKVSP
ncbi:MAG: NFACT family protein [Lachnospiraceae bacterium]|nr:NFACT family protein [Lachnospiraceae bacterium]